MLQEIDEPEKVPSTWLQARLTGAALYPGLVQAQRHVAPDTNEAVAADAAGGVHAVHEVAPATPHPVDSLPKLQP
jgi:hypothetical protein